MRDEYPAATMEVNAERTLPNTDNTRNQDPNETALRGPYARSEHTMLPEERTTR